MKKIATLLALSAALSAPAWPQPRPSRSRFLA